MSKQYQIENSFFYKLGNKKKLEQFLGLEKNTLSRNSIKKMVKYQTFVHKHRNKERIIEAPNARLKYIQKQIYKYLSRIEKPEWLMSGKKGISYVNNSESHQKNKYIVIADLAEFYSSCSQKSVYNFFLNNFKMSNDIAGLLTRLGTYKGHIITGTPLSQLYAFWSCESMFKEIYELSRANRITFTLYVDDMTFSSDNAVSTEFIWRIDKICRKHGHKLNNRKVRYYKTDSYKIITGVCLSPDNKILVPNSLSEKIHNEIMKQIDSNGKVKPSKRLIGLILAARQIDNTKFDNLYYYLKNNFTQKNNK